MKYRVLFTAGAAIGFLLGARAGRERYEQIASASRRLAASAPVQGACAQAQRLVNELTPRVRTASRRFVGQAQDASRRVAGRIGSGAQQIAETVSGTTHELVDRVSSRGEELQSRVTNTAEDLRRRGGEQIDGVRKRVDEELERSRATQAENFLQYGSMREEALAELDDDSDRMVEPGEAR